jgi:hypothetical protein
MFRISETIRSSGSEEGGILLDINRGQMFRLNSAGSRILGLIERGHDQAQIAEEICCTYGVTIEMARSDVRDFFEALYKHQVLKSGRSVEPANGYENG